MTRRLAAILVVLLTCLVTASALAQPRAPAPTLRMLPTPGPVSERSAELVNGWRLAQAALRMRLPVPAGRSMTASMRWSRETFAPWLQRKIAAIRSAETALQPLAARLTTESLVGAALIGLLYEDLASAIRSVPVPGAIAQDPELATTFVGMLDEQARAMLDRSIAAYTFCATRTDAPGALAESYRAVCGTRNTALAAEVVVIDAATQQRRERRAATPMPTHTP